MLDCRFLLLGEAVVVVDDALDVIVVERAGIQVAEIESVTDLIWTPTVGEVVKAKEQ